MPTIIDRLLGRGHTTKAASGPAWIYDQDRSLGSLMGHSTQDRMKAYLRAYKVGWFYKAGAKISRDESNLEIKVLPEAADGDLEQALIPPDLDIPIEQLAPVDQLLRLLERPNPYYTGRQLRRKTRIRWDFAGAAFWFLDGMSGPEDLPSAIYGISPARMWPSYAPSGQLIGWVMDKDAPSGGVPFEPHEILAFISEGTADGYEPVGVVEAVYGEVALTERLVQHTADVLATGGRLAGAMWPKDRALTPDEYEDAKRAWRNVASDPNAARRMLLFPEPMEWAQGAATPKEIGIPELAGLSMNNILTAFPINSYMLGVPMRGGLNESGASRREEKQTYWEESIHPRVEDFEEVLQVGLVSLYEAAVQDTLNVEIIEPNLDDAPSLLEKAGAYRALIAIGFDPKVTVEAVGLDHIKWNGLPTLLDPAEQARAAEQATVAGQETDTAQGARVVVRDSDTQDNTATQQTLVGKAIKGREDVLGLAAPGSVATVRGFLRDQRQRVVEQVRKALPSTKAERLAAKADVPDWWDAAAEDALLAERLRDVYVDVTRGALQVVADTTSQVVVKGSVNRLLDEALKSAGVRITGINETTRVAVADQIAEGIRRGYSIPQIIDGVTAESYAGVRAAVAKNGIPVWDELRAETVARTETMLAYNEAALRGYREFRVQQVVAIDGDHDAQCAVRNGATYSIDDALSISDHPNGTLDWVPVV